MYKEYASASEPLSKSAQIIAILPDDPRRFELIAEGLDAYQVTRTTSPFDHSSIWMEIYPKGVSKGESSRWLCNRLAIDPQKSFGVGNDYNDINLLDFAAKSYLVANGPKELQQRYAPTQSNDQDGFYWALADCGLL